MKASAQQSSNKFVSAFALHFTCSWKMGIMDNEEKHHEKPAETINYSFSIYKLSMEEKSLVVVEQPLNVQTKSVLIIEQFLNDNYRMRHYKAVPLRAA